MTDIPSDIAGKVLSVLKAPGDRLEAGEILLMVEAMKMEIGVMAEESGVIAEILVAEGDMIEEDQTVARLEGAA